MPAEIIRVELDCVTGEKIIFHRSDLPGALVKVTVNGYVVEVKPAALWLALKTLNLETE